MICANPEDCCRELTRVWAALGNPPAGSRCSDRVTALRAERDALHAQLKDVGIVPYLDRMQELARRAEKAEAERDVLLAALIESQALIGRLGGTLVGPRGSGLLGAVTRQIKENHAAIAQADAASEQT